MDFPSFMRDQSDRLSTKIYINHVWNELEANQQGVLDEDSISNFENHLPIMYEAFWSDGVQKVQSTDMLLSEIDDDLRKYILVLIYHTIRQTNESSDRNCILDACIVYLELIALNESEAFFYSKIYRIVLFHLRSSLESLHAEKKCQILIKNLRRFLRKSRLKNDDLQVSLAFLVKIIFIKSNCIYQTFAETETEFGSCPPSYESLLALKQLLEFETVSLRQLTITSCLFNGLRSYSNVITNYHQATIQANFRNLIISLRSLFAKDDYQNFMSAFINVWKHEDFIHYSEAAAIMNLLEKDHYTTLFNYLNKTILSPECCPNHLKFATAILTCPPKYATEEKVVVTNEIFLKSIILNCLSEKNEVCETALECLASVLLSPDKSQVILKDPITHIFNKSTGRGFLPLTTILGGLKSLVAKKWTNRAKNKHLFAIILSIISVSESEHAGLYREIFEVLCEEASPFDLKAYLPLMGETYIKLCERKFRGTADQILKVIFKCSLDSLATSTEFLKYLYNSMVNSSPSSKYFIEDIISEDYKFEEFFRKCKDLKLIDNKTIVTLMKKLDTLDDAHFKFICAVVDFSEFSDLLIISNYIERNNCSSNTLNYLLFIYNKIWKKGVFESDREVISCNIKMANYLLERLRRKTFGLSCISNAFSLFKALKSYVNLEESWKLLQNEYDAKLLAGLENGDAFIDVDIMYYSQLVLFACLLPSDEAMKILTEYLKKCTIREFRDSVDLKAEVWTAALLLYTNICLIQPNYVETGIYFLLNVQNSDHTSVKLAAIDMTFDLCNLITHNFEDLISYMFRQILFGDQVYKRTCLKKIDQLIRDGFLKLDLSQFIIFMSMLCNRNSGGISDWFGDLLHESFFIQRKIDIAKHFVAFLVHLNGYKEHNLYQLSRQDIDLMAKVVKNVSNRRQIYKLLLSNIELKTRFTLISVFTSTILEKVLGKMLAEGDGFWKMVKDSIFVFKLIDSKQAVEYDASYVKKLMTKIKKSIVQKPNIDHLKAELLSHHKEIVHCSVTILKIFFFCTDRKMKCFIFECILYWTDYLANELVYLIYVDRIKALQIHYEKFEKYYTENSSSLLYFQVPILRTVKPPSTPSTLHSPTSISLASVKSPSTPSTSRSNLDSYL